MNSLKDTAADVFKRAKYRLMEPGFKKLDLNRIGTLLGPKSYSAYIPLTLIGNINGDSNLA